MLNSSWRQVALGEVINLKRGYDLRRNDRNDGNVPVVSSSGVSGLHNRSKVKAPGVVTGRYGTLGEVFYITEDFWPLNTTLYVQDFKGNHPRFISYFLRTLNLANYNDKSSVPGLNRNHLHTLEVVIPSLSEQRRIAHILSTLDDKIELNRQMNETLEAMARAIFKSWFVDFDPVRAKMEGRTPTGMDAETASLFPSAFQDSELGKIPKGWEVGRLANLVGFQNGYAFKSTDWTNTGIPVVKIGSIKPGVVDLTQVSYVSEQVAKQSERYRLKEADLLIGMTGYVGEVGLVPPADVFPLLNQRVGKFILPEQGTSCLAYIYCLTRDSEFRFYVESRAHGTAQANVSATSILDYQITIPSDEVRIKFDVLCKPMFDCLLSRIKEIETLSQIRDTLLPKLLSGEIRVADAETHIEAIK